MHSNNKTGKKLGQKGTGEFANYRRKKNNNGRSRRTRYTSAGGGRLCGCVAAARGEVTRVTGYDHGGTEAGDGAAAPAPPGHPTTAHLTSQYGSTFFTWILVQVQYTKNYQIFHLLFYLLLVESTKYNPFTLSCY